MSGIGDCLYVTLSKIPAIISKRLTLSQNLAKPSPEWPYGSTWRPIDILGLRLKRNCFYLVKTSKLDWDWQRNIWGRQWRIGTVLYRQMRLLLRRNWIYKAVTLYGNIVLQWNPGILSQHSRVGDPLLVFGGPLLGVQRGWFTFYRRTGGWILKYISIRS